VVQDILHRILMYFPDLGSPSSRPRDLFMTPLNHLNRSTEEVSSGQKPHCVLTYMSSLTGPARAGAECRPSCKHLDWPNILPRLLRCLDRERQHLNISEYACSNDRQGKRRSTYQQFLRRLCSTNPTRHYKQIDIVPRRWDQQWPRLRAR
jgi:hypothetical protein